MNERLKNLLAEAIDKNVTFQGQVGSLYTVQEILHTLSLRSINEVWKSYKKRLDALDTDTLFSSKNTSKEKELSFACETIKELFLYKKELIDKAKELEKASEERNKKLAFLKQLKTKKEYEALESLDNDSIDKEIASLSDS